jgi:hypothetical protein
MATVPGTPAELEQNSDDVGAGEPNFPEGWRWDLDGDVVSGKFVRWDKGATREYGKKLIMVLEVDGRERSVWLLQTALYERIRDELSERPDRRLAFGERVTVHRQAETTTQDGKRTYRPFRAYFPDRPELDVDREFKLDAPTARAQREAERTSEPASTPLTGSSDALDDDIPF